MPSCTCGHAADRHPEEDEKFPCELEDCRCKDYDPVLVE